MPAKHKPAIPRQVSFSSERKILPRDFSFWLFSRAHLKEECQSNPVFFSHGCTIVLCSEPVSPNRLRKQVHHSNAKTRREFISSALGPKSHPTQGNTTRAPNKGVRRLIYRQFFVSVTGVAGVTWLARPDELISCLFLVNMTQVLETVVWSLTLGPSQGDSEN